MNRIILIGNGFDLAHGMKTSYNDFLDDFWDKQIDEISSSDLEMEIWKFENNYISLTQSVHITELKNPLFDDYLSPFDSFLEFVKANNLKIKYKNKFIQIISQKSNAQNWVDIENEYYEWLKGSMRSKHSGYRIVDLNKDFMQVKDLLGSYLSKIELQFDKSKKDIYTKYSIGSKIFAPIVHREFTEESINKLVEEQFNKISNEIESLRKGIVSQNEISEVKLDLIKRLDIKLNTRKIKEEIRELILSDTDLRSTEVLPKSTLLLNFNYTSNHLIYQNQRDFIHKSKISSKMEHIQIHGSLYSRDKNPIIFGFGDELDDDYLPIEKLNDNRYLENIKSIRYFDSANYKRLLRFINSGNYQVFIFGHSCGISDRTLLNTLFENENCHSIKPFYFRKNEEEDNYTDIVRNISRNFTDKVSMRDKVVNKEFCEPLT